MKNYILLIFFICFGINFVTCQDDFCETCDDDFWKNWDVNGDLEPTIVNAPKPPCFSCECDDFWCEDPPTDPCPSGIYDACGVCDGDGSSCADPPNPPDPDCPEGYDDCGVCDGDGSSCEDPPPNDTDDGDDEQVKKKKCDKAKLANHIYNVLRGRQISGKEGLNSNNMSLVDPDDPILNDLNINLSSDLSGFNSAIYKITHSNGDIEYVYSFAGTDDWEDVGNDLGQAFGYDAVQIQNAYDNALAFAEWSTENNFNVSFTGHSLGGGLANIAALATGISAIIFNPAGIHDNTISNFNLDLGNSNFVDAYIVNGEIVSIFNETLGTPVRGNVNKIEDALSLAEEAIYKITTPGGPVVRSGILHTMAEVLAALGCN